MDALRPPSYVCLRRKARNDGNYNPMTIDGRYSAFPLLFAAWPDSITRLQCVQGRLGARAVDGRIRRHRGPQAQAVH